MTNPIPDFTDSERQLVSQTLFERYGRQVPVEAADAELQLDPLFDDFSTCPTLYWVERGAHFVVFKVAAKRFRAQFYYGEAEQFGVGKDEFDEIGDCVITLLQVQSDHELQSKGVRSGMNAVDFDKANDGEDPFPPILI
jgi:hypothetical protein